MNDNARKKRNTALFITLATIGNIVLMFIFFILGFVLLGMFGNPEDEGGNMLWIMVIFFVSIGLSWFIYSRFVKWFTKRVDADETFAPVFSSKKGASSRRGGDGAPKMNMKE